VRRFPPEDGCDRRQRNPRLVELRLARRDALQPEAGEQYDTREAPEQRDGRETADDQPEPVGREDDRR